MNGLYLLLVLITTLLTPGFSGQPRSPICSELRDQKKAMGSLTEAEIGVYCEHNCTFIRGYMCMPPDEGSWLPDLSFMTNFGKKWKARATDGDLPPWFRTSTSPKLYVDVFTFFVPYLFCIVPILLQWIFIGSDSGRGAKDRGLLIFVNFIIWIGYVIMYWGRIGLLINYSTYAFLSAFSITQGRIFSELIATYLSLIVLVGLSLLQPNWIIQLIGGAAVTVLLFGIFFRAVQSKNEGGRVSILTSVNGLWMTVSFMNYLLQRLAAENAALAFVRLAIYAFMPYGPTVSFATNSLAAAGQLIAEVTVEDEDISVGIFLASVVGYWTFFLLSRASIGMMVLARLRFDWNLNALLTGLYAYSVDIVGPFTTAFVALFNRDERSARRFMYACVMIGLLLSEIWYAQEVVLVRLMIWATDMTVIRSGLADAARFLECDICLEGVAFPKVGAFPFACLDALNAVRQCVYRLTVSVHVDSGQMDSLGVGTVIGDNETAKLITVRHVLDAKHTVRLDREQIVEEIRSPMNIGTSRDPCVSMGLLSRPSNVARISMLALREVRSVAYLVMLSPEGMIGLVTDWSFDRQGDLHAVINLKKGDSGSPLVAVLIDGSLRFAGTVSRGTPNEGIPNIISCVASDEPELSGSPGRPAAYLELPNIRTLDQAGIIHRIETMLVEENERFRNYFSHDLDRWNESKKQFDWNDLPPDEYKRKKGRLKNYRKDARVRKEGLMALTSLSNLSESDVATVHDAFDNARVQRFNIKRRHQVGMSGLGFVPSSS